MSGLATPLTTVHDASAGPDALDPHGFRQLLERLPDQCHEGIQRALRLPALQGPFRSVVVSGMGGSAVSGDLAGALLWQSLAVPLHVIRGYDLPVWAGNETLVIAVSYSGETEETLSVVAQSLERKASLVAVTSGGELAREAERRGIPLVAVPQGLPPRGALGYLLFAVLTTLERAGVAALAHGEIDEALQQLADDLRTMVPAVPVGQNVPMQLAERLAARTPVIYGSAPLTEAVAYRWKTQLEENAKVFAVSGSVPECDHNEIVGWEGDALTERCHAVFLRDRGEDPRVAARMVATREIAGRRAPNSEVWSRGEGRLARMLSLIQIGDWTSYYLARLRVVDPWPVEAIDRLKRRLSQ